MNPQKAFDSQSVCYIIQAKNGGPIKIGHARPLSERISGIQTGNPYPLCLRAVFEHGRKTEKHLHGLCADHRLQGEWFHERAIPLLLTHIEIGWGVLWTEPWETVEYPPLVPTAAEVRAKLRAFLADTDRSGMRWLKETINNPAAEGHAEATRMVREYVG